jgi:hypothetical protein
MKNIITQRQFTSSSGEQNSHLTASKTSSPGTKNVITWHQECHHPASKTSSSGTKNVITRRQKRHHPASKTSSPGVKNVITRLVRVIQIMVTA